MRKKGYFWELTTRNISERGNGKSISELTEFPMFDYVTLCIPFRPVSGVHAHFQTERQRTYNGRHIEF